MQHGSLTNMIMGAAKSANPEVGMGATEIMYSDRKPYTVVEVITPKKVVIQADNYKRTDNEGMSEHQEYTYTPNPDGRKVTITLRPDGCWREVGTRKGDVTFLIGHRERYYDFSF